MFQKIGKIIIRRARLPRLPFGMEIIVPGGDKPGLPNSVPVGGIRLLEAWRANRSESTIKAYLKDLLSFSRWASLDGDPGAVVSFFASLKQVDANSALLSWQSQMRDAGLSNATINRRTATLQSLGRIAYRIGLLPYELSIEALRVQRVKDVAGVRHIEWQAMLDEAARSARDYCILRLLHDLGLRRSEVSSLDWEHFDDVDCKISILGKGRSQRERLTLPVPTVKAIREYQAGIVKPSGPMFLSSRGNRLSGHKIAQVVRRISKRTTGRGVGPHRLRHLAITKAVIETRGDVPKVQAFSRHKSYTQVMTYVDRWHDDQGDVANMVAGR